jgi:hypothetical protein
MAEEGEIGLFDWLNSINHHKQDLMSSELLESKYDPFMVRRGLGMNHETLYEASNMNQLHDIDSYMQYQYLLAAIPKKKRYNKWIKKSIVSEELKMVCSFYKVNQSVGESYLRLMTNAQIEALKEWTSGGGKRNDKDS